MFTTQSAHQYLLTAALKCRLLWQMHVPCMSEYSDLFRVRLYSKNPNEYSNIRYNCFTPSYLPVHSVFSLFILLAPCPFYCYPVYSIVSLSILLSPCPFCCLTVHSVISLFILLSPCPFCCIPFHSVVLQRRG